MFHVSPCALGVDIDVVARREEDTDAAVVTHPVTLMIVMIQDDLAEEDTDVIVVNLYSILFCLPIVMIMLYIYIIHMLCNL